MLLAGCLHSSEGIECERDGMSWVCPSSLACADPPTYCGTQSEVGACEGKPDRDPCSTPLVEDGQCIAGQCTMCSNDITGCRYTGWRLMTSAFTGNLSTVAFTGEGEAYAGGIDAGANPVILRYQESRWDVDTRFSGPAGAAINGLVAAGNKVYALVGNQSVYVLDGGTWSALPMPPASYTIMWAAPDGHVFLAGLGGVTAQFDGTAWTPGMAGTQTLLAISGTSSSDVYAVGNASTIQHWNGSAWTAVANPGSGNLTAVWASGSDVFAAGSQAYLHSATPGTFTAIPAAPIAPAKLWGSAPTDVFAVGNMGATGEIFHWDGLSWSQFQLSASPKLASVEGSSAAEVFAVGAGGSILRYTGNGWASTTQPAPAVAKLYGVWAASPTELFATAETGKLLHYVDLPMPKWTVDTSNSVVMNGITGRSASDVTAVGEGTSVHWNGSTWAAMSSTALNSAVAVATNGTQYASAGEFVATNPGTSTWTQLTTDAASYRAIWFTSAKYWIAGPSGVGHVDGTSATSDLTGAYNALWGTSDSDVFAAGAATIQHFDGTAWTAQPPDTSATLAGLWGRASDDVFAVGAGGTVVHYHAGLWRLLDSPGGTDDLAAISGAGSSVFVVSRTGAVYKLISSAP